MVCVNLITSWELRKRKEYYWFNIQFGLVWWLSIMIVTSFVFAPFFMEETERDLEIQDLRFFYGNRWGVISILAAVCMNKWQHKVGIYALFQVGLFARLNDFANYDSLVNAFAMFILGLIFTLLNVVEERQLKSYLRKLEVKLVEEKSWKSLVEQMTEGIACIDEDDQIVFMNQACEELNNPGVASKG